MPVQAPTNPLAPADVLIVTALREERDAVKAVITGALGDSWVTERAPSTELRIERRSFSAADGGKLHVALICAEDMGGTQSAGVAGPVVMALRPRCLAMCGVLAGRVDDTEFGDVIFADQLFLHDSGKRKETGFEHALRPHKLDIRWLEKARDFAEDPGDALAWLEGPDWTEEQQRAWLLDQFARARNPQSLGPLIEECCPRYESIISRLLDEDLVHVEEDPLTEKGKRHVAEQRFKSQRWPGLDPPRRSLRVRVGPIASGNAVQADPALWKELAVFARKTLGVEMEAHAVGNTAELHQVELAVVMKGVMDHADIHKDDRYKPFAARASAECLLAFLRKYLTSRVRPDYDDILSPGIATLPEKPSPSQLLMSTYEVVEFYRAGRTVELAAMEAWCMTGGEVRGRLIHGPGGFGKTRFAIEWTRELQGRGWAAGFLRAGAADDWFQRLLALGRPTAVVIDYAESHTGLRGLLEPMIRYAQADGNKTRVRVLLLARTVGDWWDALIARDELLRAFLTEVAPRSLAPLAAVTGDRVEVFRQAVNAFSLLRKRPIPREVPDDLSDPIFERVLYLHMAALAVVDGLDFRTMGRVIEEKLMDAILDHEERFWDERQSWDDRRQRIRTEQARQLVSAATLRGGLPTREVANAVATSVLGTSYEHLVMLVHDIYGVPDHGGCAAAYAGPLAPDLLGEGMVRRIFDRVNERPEDFIERVFGEDDGDAILNGFIILGRISTGTGTRIRPWIDRLLAKHFAERALIVFEAAKLVGKHTAFSELGDALADALQREGTKEIAGLIELSGIHEQTITLRRVAVWVYQALLDDLPKTYVDETNWRRARLLHNLGVKQLELGHSRLALRSIWKATRIYRRLVKKKPDGVLPYLARTVGALSAMQNELGRYELAFASAAEAVRINRILVKADADLSLPNLAMSLTILGSIQGALLWSREALLSTEEAVDIYQGLVAQGFESRLPDLGGSLNNLSNMQSALGLRALALGSAEKAVGIFRKWASVGPDAFLPDLAKALGNLGVRQYESEELRAASETLSESFSLYWQLFEMHPDVFGREMVQVLKNLLVALRAMRVPMSEDLLERLERLRRAGIDVLLDG